MLDSTAIRAHQHAAGAKKHGPQALGRACGGFGTKIHAIVDAPYHSIDFTLSGSEQSDIGQAAVNY